MILALFDLDGTLMNTSRVDGLCFLQALELEFGITQVSADWENYPHPTDWGVLIEVFRRKLGRQPDEAETGRFKARFFELLREESRRDPGLFSEVPGAGDLLAELGQTPGVAVGVATGGWRVSAEFKFSRQGWSLDDFPAATSDDGPAREDVVRTGILRAETRYRTQFSKTVSIGDGLWDVRTARKLKLPFIGVGQAEQFEAWGESRSVRDFSDRAAFLELLFQA